MNIMFKIIARVALGLVALSAASAQTSNIARVENRSTLVYLDVGRTLTSSFVVDSSKGDKDTGKPVYLIRALGKTLRKLGVEDAMPQPVIEVYRNGKRWDGAAASVGQIRDAEVRTGATPSGVGDFSLTGIFPDGTYNLVVRPGFNSEDGSLKGGSVLLETWQVTSLEALNRAPVIQAVLSFNAVRLGENVFEARAGIPFTLSFITHDPDKDDVVNYTIQPPEDTKLLAGSFSYLDGSGFDGLTYVAYTPGYKVFFINAYDRQGKMSDPFIVMVVIK